jgi:hypothetical protein
MSDLMERIIGGFCALALGLIALIWKGNESKHKKAEDRMDVLYDRISNLEMDTVGRDTIVRLENEWRNEVRQLRGYLDASIVRVHDRIEEIREGVDELGQRMNDQHSAILNKLIEWKDS